MRDPLFWVPVKIKLPLSFALICLTVLGIGGGIVASITKQNLERQILLFLDLHSTAQAAIIDRQIELLGRRVEDFASDGYIRTRLQLLTSEAPNSEKANRTKAELVQHLLINKLSLGEHFSAAMLIDKRGRLVLQAGSCQPIGEPVLGTSNTSFGSFETDQDDSALSFRITTPITDIKGLEKLGCLQVIVRADRWVQRLQSQGPLTSRVPSRAWLEDEEGSALQLQGLSQGQEESKFITKSQSLARSRWRLYSSLQKSTLTSPIRTLSKQLAFTGLLLLCVVAIFLYFPTKFLVEPLGILKNNAKRMAAGDFSVRAFNNSLDEIGELSRAFNTMADAVGERTHQLKKKANELKLREAEIRRQRDRLETVIRSMKDGLFILDRSGRVALSNKAASPVVAELKARISDKLEGVTQGRLCTVKCPASQSEKKACLSCLRGLESFSHYCEVQVESRVYEIQGTKLRVGDESTTERLFVTRDITERRAEADRQAQQERMAVLGQLAAVMAHELNNPLAAISMFSQILESSLEKGTSNHECAEVIRRNTDSCKNTIQMFLESTAPASPEFSKVEVRELVENIQYFLRPLYHKVNAQLKIDDRCQDSEIDGDQHQLRQLLVNLLMNAIQTGEQCADLVTLKIEDADSNMKITISDNGPGIPATVQDHIFKPFFTTKTPELGTGLGLPISKRIVEAHGGSIKLSQSTPGNTEFQIMIPRKYRSSYKVLLSSFAETDPGPVVVNEV
jgi:signal transduction histidine kinase